MAKTTTIKLADLKIEPLVGHHGMVSQVVIREPTYDEYQELGEPRIYYMAGDETAVPIEDKEIIQQYLVRCIVEPQDQAVLAQGNIKLARALKRALLDFFRFGDEEDEASTTSPTSSSSTDASPSTPAR